MKNDGEKEVKVEVEVEEEGEKDEEGKTQNATYHNQKMKQIIMNARNAKN